MLAGGRGSSLRIEGEDGRWTNVAAVGKVEEGW